MKTIGICVARPEKAKNYTDALVSAGLETVIILPGQDLSALNNINGLVLTGGEDINPHRYSQEAAPETGTPNNARDHSEIELVKIAALGHMPVLAICRGMQVLNVAFGGTLTQHIECHRREGQEGAILTHEIAIVGGSLLHRILGKTRTRVNSYHHQGVAQVGRDLVAPAWAVVPDRVIEAIEMPKMKFVLGVQWHPEKDYQDNADSQKIFQAFADSIS